MTTPRPTSVLVVEDEETISTQIRAALADGGYRIAGIAQSAERALWALENRSADIVLMDIELAGEMDGIDAAQKIRDRWAIPVVFLTGHSDGPTLARASSTEPYSFLVKPLHERDLRAAIEISIYRHAAEQERARLLAQLQASEAEVERLRTLLPICAWCGQIRTDDGAWLSVDEYLGRRLKANLTHGICVTCRTEMDPDLN